MTTKIAVELEKNKYGALTIFSNLNVAQECRDLLVVGTLSNKYPRVQQMRPRAHFRLLNTFFDFKKNKLFFRKKYFYFEKFITRKILGLEHSSLHQKV